MGALKEQSSSRREGEMVVNVRMPAELYELLRARASEQERSMAQMIRWALRQQLDVSV